MWDTDIEQGDERQETARERLPHLSAGPGVGGQGQGPRATAPPALLRSTSPAPPRQQQGQNFGVRRRVEVGRLSLCPWGTPNATWPHDYVPHPGVGGGHVGSTFQVRTEAQE